MRRNAILAGVLSLLLSITTLVWAGPSVANDAPPATASHTAAVRRASTSKRIKRRTLLAAATVTPARSTSAVHPAVDQPTITEHHQKLATTTLNALPTGCRDHLKNFSILYTGATRRGLGGKTTIILDGSVSDTEFVALLTHECAHVMHGNLLGSAISGESAFRDGGDTFSKDSPMLGFWQISWVSESVRRVGAKDSDFVSGYAKSDAFEEFAETFAAYALQRDLLRARAKENTAIAAKLAWMETNLPLPEDSLGNGTATWDGTVPWDITKLPFTL